MSTFSGIPGVPSTSVPAIQFTPQGPILPSDADILAGVQIDVNYAFGGGVNPKLTTPQGQLASSEAAVISDKNAQIALICNQVDPQFATGRFQDAIGRIYFMERDPATATVVSCLLNGPGGLVPAGTLAQDTSGNTYTLLAAVTIPSSGNVMGSFANIVTGPIPCPAGTLTQVFQAVTGWDAITNPTDGVLGSNVESPQAFEFRRQQSVAINASGTVPAIRAKVFAVTNVIDAYVIDNPAGVTVPTGSTNFPLKPNSLYVAVVGGAETDIVNAIWNKKNVGCNYNGNTTQNVLDMSYSAPQPSYAVSYEIPAPLPVLFAIQILNNPTLPSNIVALVQAAVIAQFNGTNGASRARIGGTVFASSYFGPIASVATNVLLVSVQVGTSVANANSVQIGIDQSPSISAENIAVTLV